MSFLPFSFCSVFVVCRWIFLFILVSSSWVEVTSLQQQRKLMPTFNFTISLKNNGVELPGVILMQYFSAVVRYYDALGDGSKFGWMDPVATPTALIDGVEVDTSWIFRYNLSSYPFGGTYLGYDQFAQYLGVNLTNSQTANKRSFTLSIVAPFQKVDYLSITIYKRNYILEEDGSVIQFGTEEIVLDEALPVVHNNPNPYVYGNPTVMSYYQLPSNNISSVGFSEGFLLLQNHETVVRPQAPVGQGDFLPGQIPLYRLDKVSSRRDLADDVAEDGCSKAYLFGYRSCDAQEMFIVRVKVPFTFLRDMDTSPDMVFDSYQTRYFSISANQVIPEYDTYDNYTAPLYWSVNARMLLQYMDSDGYAVVFLSPNNFTQSLAAQQKLDETEPPVMTWGRYTGYVLGDPSYAIILRYRAPLKSWQGSPENAQCYATPMLAQPLSVGELGDYTPEIFAGSLADFQSGSIGVVEKDAAWPSPSN